MAATTIAVTGADGFIGVPLCAALEAQGFAVARLVRRAEGIGRDRRVADLQAEQDYAALLRDVSVVVHLAGRAHVMRETEADPRAAFWRINVDATMRLARAAADAGVRRFVFVSSIHVNGTETCGTPFTEADEPAPLEAYGQSKLEAERSLVELCKQRGMEWVIVRPPLVYGPGVKGNFQRLLRLAEAGVPLPLGRIHNRRSLIGVENLASLLILCATHPAAAGQTFLAAEPQPHSTADLIAALAHALGRPNRVFGFPVGLLRACTTVLGRQADFEKLCGSLEVSSLKAQRVLGWTPRLTFAEQIARTVHAPGRGSHGD
jgi:nucleoside-diphosphate-sugar epimerase